MKYKNYTFEHDGQCWELRKTVIGQDKKTKEPKEISRFIGFYPKLEVVFKNIIEHEAGNCETIDELGEKLDSIKRDLTNILWGWAA